MTTDRPDGGGETAGASLRRQLIGTGIWRAPGSGGPRWQGHPESGPSPPCPPSPAANAVSTASGSYRARLNHWSTDPTPAIHRMSYRFCRKWCLAPQMTPPAAHIHAEAPARVAARRSVGMVLGRGGESVSAGQAGQA